MGKSLKEIFSDEGALFKILEIILCIIGLVMMEFTFKFYSRGAYEGLIVGFGGYLLICSLSLLALILEEAVSKSCNSLYMIVGTIYNIIGGAFSLYTYDHRHSLIIWSTISSYTDSDIKNPDLGMGIVALLLGMVMLIDVLMDFLVRK